LAGVYFVRRSVVIRFAETFANVFDAGEEQQARDGEDADHGRDTTEWGQLAVLVTTDDRLIGTCSVLIGAGAVAHFDIGSWASYLDGAASRARGQPDGECEGAKSRHP